MPVFQHLKRESTYLLSGIIFKSKKTGRVSSFAKRDGRWYTFRDGRIVRVMMKQEKESTGFISDKHFRKNASVLMAIYHKAKSAQ